MRPKRGRQSLSQFLFILFHPQQISFVLRAVVGGTLQKLVLVFVFAFLSSGCSCFLFWSFRLFDSWLIHLRQYSSSKFSSFYSSPPSMILNQSCMATYQTAFLTLWNIKRIEVLGGSFYSLFVFLESHFTFQSHFTRNVFFVEEHFTIDLSSLRIIFSLTISLIRSVLPQLTFVTFIYHFHLSLTFITFIYPPPPHFHLSPLFLPR